MAGFDLATMKDRAVEVSGGFTKAQKILIVGGAVAVVVAILAFTKLAGGEEYATLYATLEPTDAAAVTERLDSDGIAYELADGGSTVKVPKGTLYETRMQLSADGLPSGGAAGWSILDGQGITASEFSQRVGYQRALEGELARTIRSIDGVEGATVHLALPRETAFALDDSEASASVMIQSTPGQTLDTVQVQAVVNLVASSVDKLDPADITVADSTGMVLAAPGQRSMDFAGNDLNMRQAAAYEERVAAEIKGMLTSVVGPNSAVVTVSAELDFDESTLTSETYEDPVTDPDGPRVAISESTKTEEYIGEGTGVAGVLGPEGAEGGAGTAGPGTEYNLDEVDRNFAVNRVVESVNRAPGTVERISVAVLVDEASTNPGMLEEIEALVTAGADIRAERGDTLAVSRLPFDTSMADGMAEELEAAATAKATEDRQQLLQTIVLAVVVLIVLAVAWRNMRKASKRRAELAAQFAPRALEMPGVAPGMSVGEAAAARAVGAGGGSGMGLDLDSLNDLVVAPSIPSPAIQAASEVAEMIDNQPEEVAQLLRGWLGDRRAGAR
ncbi:MAG: flagellar M-ring protein FliF [Acidimicrobiia bacterium]|nr:flagellar M-ring protein FliF [Acidimicrobiia bacterium]